MGIAESIAVDKGVLKGEKISVGWWRRFLERQPNLTLRRGDSTAHVQMDAVNQETMDQYFSLLGEVLMEHNLVDKPSQIYNVDESGVPLDPKPPNKITKKGSRSFNIEFQEGASNNCWLFQCYWTGNSTHGYFQCTQSQPCMDKRRISGNQIWLK